MGKGVENDAHLQDFAHRRGHGACGCASLLSLHRCVLVGDRSVRMALLVVLFVVVRLPDQLGNTPGE